MDCASISVEFEITNVSVAKIMIGSVRCIFLYNLIFFHIISYKHLSNGYYTDTVHFLFACIINNVEMVIIANLMPQK